MKEKRSVGRPKLASSDLKKKSVIVLSICFFSCLILIISGINSITGNNIFDNLTANVTYDKIQKLKAGTYPPAITIEPATTRNGYAKNQFRYTINTSNLKKNELKNLYVVTRLYNMKDSSWNAKHPRLVTEYMDKILENRYSKLMTIDKYYSFELYSGKTKCYTYFYNKEKINSEKMLGHIFSFF